jgi:hypothetical protein
MNARRLIDETADRVPREIAAGAKQGRSETWR